MVTSAHPGYRRRNLLRQVSVSHTGKKVVRIDITWDLIIFIQGVVPGRTHDVQKCGCRIGRHGAGPTVTESAVHPAGTLLANTVAVGGVALVADSACSGSST
jgi:hypothetical protein